MRSIIIKLIFTALLAASTYVTLVSAADHEINWTTGSLYARIRSPVAGSGYCEKEQVQIVPYDATIERETQTISACVVHGNNVDMLEGLVSSGSGMSQVNRQYAIRIGQDKAFHYLDTTTRWSYMLSGDDIITAVEDDRYRIAVIKDARAALKPVQKWIDSRGVARMYTFDLGSAGVYRKTSNSWMGDISVSRNGQYITSQQGNYLTRTNTENGNEVRYILPEKDNHAVGTVRAITNDGSIGLLSGNHSIIDFDSCETETDWMSGYHGMEVRCATRSFKDTITPLTGELGSVEMYALFSDGGETLTFSLFNAEHKFVTVVVSLRYQGNNDSSEATPLRYLALGDSFSSGEGNLSVDGDGNPGYRWGTDIDGDTKTPQEKCHLSESSYPYKLASSMNYGEFSISPDMSWSSVACAGALIEDIKGAGSADYKGQGSRLAGFDVEEFKAEALNDMIPGRQKQIEFIKKYQPKAVTMTVGGNDIRFADIVNACVNPILRGGEWTTTCSYAKDNEKKANIAYSILSLRDDLVSLYTELLAAGRYNMKLYIASYPLFVSDDIDAKCNSNVRLNYEERRMTVESIKFLNQIIRSAADEAGAIYIDTETSLGAHVLCGSSEMSAVNGVVLNEKESSFHPNPYGHSLLALRVIDALNGKSLDEFVCTDSGYISCPGGSIKPLSIPSYFKQAINENIQSTIDQDIIADIINAPGNVFIWVGDHTVGANNPLDVVIYSEKRVIGTYMANERGGYSGNITLPRDLPYGYHTLEITSKDEQGNPVVKLWKIFEYRSDDPNDFDGDGVANKDDLNQYYNDRQSQSDITSVPSSVLPTKSSEVEARSSNFLEVSTDKVGLLKIDDVASTDSVQTQNSIKPSRKVQDIAIENGQSVTSAKGAMSMSAILFLGGGGMIVLTGIGMTIWVRKRRNY